MTDPREQGRVALFIDWDNLQISTQNDYQDRVTPDIATIVQKAQEYGQVIVARAYAEWQRHEDRLEIYRNGLEPVYAPVFRFEPDPATPSIKGKSLADPVMVSDCVDLLHLMPTITTYVLVTGDKDLIPVVRLAKLRGKRTVLVAPEYVARELEKMVDEIVYYRDLIGATAAPRTPAHQRSAQQARLAAESLHRGHRERSPAPRPLPRGAMSSRSAPPPVVDAPPPKEEATPVEVAVVVAAAPTVAAPEGLESIDKVYTAIVDILQKMAAQNKGKVRATNLKDKLLERSLSFSEKQYGFTKFKDLLFAAQRAGVLQVTSTGPVQWVQLPTVREAPAEPAVVSPATVAPRPMPAPIAQPGPTVEPVVEVAEPVEFDPAQRDQIIRYIDELRTRSRWLTYTYVLTNVTAYLRAVFQEQGLAEHQADTEARGILNHLVQLGVLRVDKEPREVDVNGARHRIRMCHLEETSPYVVAAIGRAAPTETAAATPVVADSAPPIESAPVEAPTFAATPIPESVVGAPSAPSVESSVAAAAVAGHGDAGPSAAVETAEPAITGVTSTVEVDGSAVTEAPRGGRRTRGETTDISTETPAEAAQTDSSAPVAVVAAPPVVSSNGPVEAVAPAAPPAPTTPAPVVAAFEALVEVVRQATRAGGGPVKASGLKLRLGRRFGSFDERRLGFDRFSDFLEAAERAGLISVATNNQGAFVTLPDSE